MSRCVWITNWLVQKVDSNIGGFRDSDFHRTWSLQSYRGAISFDHKSNVLTTCNSHGRSKSCRDSDTSRNVWETQGCREMPWNANLSSHIRSFAIASLVVKPAFLWLDSLFQVLAQTCVLRPISFSEDVRKWFETDLHHIWALLYCADTPRHKKESKSLWSRETDAHT